MTRMTQKESRHWRLVDVISGASYYLLHYRQHALWSHASDLHSLHVWGVPLLSARNYSSCLYYVFSTHRFHPFVGSRAADNSVITGLKLILIHYLRVSLCSSRFGAFPPRPRKAKKARHNL